MHKGRDREDASREQVPKIDHRSVKEPKIEHGHNEGAVLHEAILDECASQDVLEMFRRWESSEVQKQFDRQAAVEAKKAQ